MAMAMAIHEILSPLCACVRIGIVLNFHKHTPWHSGALSTQKHHLAQHAFISLSVWVVWEQAFSNIQQLTPLTEIGGCEMTGGFAGRRLVVGYYKTQLSGSLGSGFSPLLGSLASLVLASLFWIFSPSQRRSEAERPTLFGCQIYRRANVRKLVMEEPSWRTQSHRETQALTHVYTQPSKAKGSSGVGRPGRTWSRSGSRRGLGPETRANEAKCSHRNSSSRSRS